MGSRGAEHVLNKAMVPERDCSKACSSGLAVEQRRQVAREKEVAVAPFDLARQGHIDGGSRDQQAAPAILEHLHP